MRGEMDYPQRIFVQIRIGKVVLLSSDIAWTTG